MAGSSREEAGQEMGAADWGMLAALSLLWGGSFFFTGVAVRELPAFTIVAARVGIAAVALWAVLAASRIRVPRAPRVWAAFLGMGLLNNAVPFTLFVWGQQHVTSGLAAILNATTPLFTVVVAHLLTEDERLTPSKAAGIVAGLTGVAVMLGTDLLAGLGTALAAQCATLVMLPLALLVDRPWTLPMPGPWTWGALVGLGLLSTAVAYVLYFRILAAAGATNLLLVTFLIPASAILLGALVLGDRLEPKHSVGTALIGVDLASIDGRPPRTLLRRRSVRTY
jgi:drug/metabolite transporter (DMT)-like permease